MKTRKQTQRLTRPESLELRLVLTGNVTASVLDLGGMRMLQLNGDAADNQLSVRGNGTGVIELTGIGTTLNGGRGKLQFSGIDVLQVDLAGGNDSLRTQSLVLSEILVRGGSGDDFVRIADTSGLSSSLAISVFGDDSLVEGDVPSNGNDRLEITGTRFDGVSMNLTLQGDTFTSGAAGGRDEIRVSNSTFEVDGDCAISILADPVTTDAGNTIVIQHTNTHSTDNPVVWWDVSGSVGDDAMIVRNVLVDIDAVEFALTNIQFYSFEGFDTLDVSNVRSFSQTSVTDFGEWDGGFGGSVNDLFLWADEVRVSNLDWEGGSTVTVDPWGELLLESLIWIVGSRTVDLDNVQLLTNGWGELAVYSEEFFTGIESSERIRLANVNVGSSFGGASRISIDAGGAQDQVAVTNTACEAIVVYAGTGDDVVSITNTRTFNPNNTNWGYLTLIDMGDGDDSVRLQNNSVDRMEISLGQGDDSAELKNNHASDSLVLNAGDGDDRVRAVANRVGGLFSLDGGAGIDSLFETENHAGLFEILSF